MFSASAWDGYLLEPFGPYANATTDEQLTALVRANAAPNGHVVGTAAMSSLDDQWGVVGPDLKVKGVEGLRIVDASVLVCVSGLVGSILDIDFL